MGEKRKRDKTLTIRLTESEKMMIEKKASKAKLNLTEYIISVSSKSKISVTEDTKPLLMELKRIGNNINQIAMKINSGVVSSYNFDEVISMQRKIYDTFHCTDCLFTFFNILKSCHQFLPTSNNNCS